MSNAVLKLLEKHFEEECESAGPANVADIVAGRVGSIESAKTGKQFDLLHLLQELAASATFIKQMIDIYLALKKQKGGKKPTADEVTKEAKKKGIKPPEDVDEKKQKEIADDIVDEDPQTSS